MHKSTWGDPYFTAHILFQCQMCEVILTFNTSSRLNKTRTTGDTVHCGHVTANMNMTVYTYDLKMDKYSEKTLMCEVVSLF